MKTAQERWKVVVDFVRENDVSDICLWAGNATVRIEGRIVQLAEKGALSTADVEEMIDELLRQHPTNAAELEKPMAGVDFSAQLFDLRR